MKHSAKSSTHGQSLSFSNTGNGVLQRRGRPLGPASAVIEPFSGRAVNHGRLPLFHLGDRRRNITFDNISWCFSLDRGRGRGPSSAVIEPFSGRAVDRGRLPLLHLGARRRNITPDNGGGGCFSLDRGCGRRPPSAVIEPLGGGAVNRRISLLHLVEVALHLEVLDCARDGSTAVWVGQCVSEAHQSVPGVSGGLVLGTQDSNLRRGFTAKINGSGVGAADG